MTTKSAAAVILALVVVVGAWLVYSKNGEQRATETETKNAEMMDNGNTTEVVGEEVDYFNGTKGYFVRPVGEGEYPGVVVIHENRGLRPEIKSAAETLAKEGYLVLAVDLLGGVAEDQDGARALTANFKQDEGVENMKAASQFLRERGASKLASLGWCFGGKQSLELALSGEKLDATVVYYGGGMATTTDRLEALDWPVLGIFGDQDRVIPIEMVDQFKASLTELEIDHEVYVYPGVGHAFANPSGANYAPNETADAWSKTLAFLERTLK